jgi:hypothetical protein
MNHEPWPYATPDEIEEYEERAAIIEYDGHVSRPEAEARARKRMERKRDRGKQMNLEVLK